MTSPPLSFLMTKSALWQGRRKNNNEKKAEKRQKNNSKVRKRRTEKKIENRKVALQMGDRCTGDALRRERHTVVVQKGD